MKPVLIVVVALIWGSAFTQVPEAYTVFTGKGKKSKFSALTKAALNSDIVYWGELHNNPIGHWLRYELLIKMYERFDSTLMVGAEMFERDNQAEINAYLNGKLDDKAFEKAVRLWTNYSTDYQPTVAFCKENGLPFIATNIPRRYASMLFKQGIGRLDTLSNEEKKWIAPLPFPLDTTLSQYNALMEGDFHTMGPNFVRAQAIKDATMAFSIMEHWKAGKKLLHLNGSYHSDFYQSILWYVNYYGGKEIKQFTVSIVEQSSLKTLEKEHLGKADFIVVVPERMTKTH